MALVRRTRREHGIKPIATPVLHRPAAVPTLEDVPFSQRNHLTCAAKARSTNILRHTRLLTRQVPRYNHAILTLVHLIPEPEKCRIRTTLHPFKLE